MGVQFLEHTADTAIEVRARSVEGCFARAAAGMFACFTLPAGTGTTASVDVDVGAIGTSELLVAWLQELIYQSEVKDLALHEFRVIRVSRNRVEGTAAGTRFGPDAISVGPAVKGVSRHGLELRRAAGTWRARLVFDV